MGKNECKSNGSLYIEIYTTIDDNVTSLPYKMSIKQKLCLIDQLIRQSYFSAKIP